MLLFYNGGHGRAVTIERRCEMLKSCRLECITSEVNSIIAQWFSAASLFLYYYITIGLILVLLYREELALRFTWPNK